eukprot:NODE_8122_length_1521_cov_6.584648.p2 GENE.NODE_8122_length_1521_cov_6.584648~~NODE_8122_length_1521_cov_6.584648.p2  ORF type:complete len:236 (+),score=68.88 NODE_8122_length_1521_cov_6.584648:256-963(+)
MQELVDKTFYGWGGLGKATRTRDRGKEVTPSRLEVVRVVHVRNAETYINYCARRTEIIAELNAHPGYCRDYNVKTGEAATGVSFVGLSRDVVACPVDPEINEFYLWHGTNARSAEAIVQDDFDTGRAGMATGVLYGPGIYFAESCLKADEYVTADAHGHYPLVLSRVTLGNMRYCDDYHPKKISEALVASCRRPGGDCHSVLGDREKVRKTFREFVVYDSDQIYPEYIVWYKRVP